MQHSRDSCLCSFIFRISGSNSGVLPTSESMESSCPPHEPIGSTILYSVIVVQSLSYDDMGTYKAQVIIATGTWLGGL